MKIAPYLAPHTWPGSLHRSLLSVGLLSVLAASPADAVDWNKTGAGPYSWIDNANWSAAFPNSIGAVANVSVDLTADQTINLNGAITVGSLTLNDTGGGTDNSFTIVPGAGGSLTFQVASGNATLNFTTGNNGIQANISAPVTFNSNTTITAGTQATNQLNLTGGLSGAGTLTKTGLGTLNIAGNNNTSFTGKWVLTGAAGNANSILRIDADNNLGAVPGTAVADFITVSANQNRILALNTMTLNENRGITVNAGARLDLGIDGNNTLTVDGKITGAGSVHKTDSGGSTLVLSNAANDFGGNLVIGVGSVSIGTIANSNVASAAGAGSEIQFSAGQFSTGGTLIYTGAAASSDRAFRQRSAGSTNGVLRIYNNGTGALTLTDTGDTVVGNSTGTKVVGLGGSNTGTNVFNQKINANSGTVRLEKEGAGTWRLNRADNDYTGSTTLTGGVLEVVKLANGGAASSIGVSSSDAANLLISGANVAGLNSTLRYVGTGDSTDRLFRIGANQSNQTGTIESSGSGAVNFTNTGAITWGTTNQTRTLALGGTNTGDNTLAASINNNGTQNTSLVKNGAGKWILTGNSTYTGATTVNAGTLLIEGSLGGTTVTVASVGAIGGDGTIGGSLSLLAGADFVFSLSDTLTVNGASVTFGGFGISDLVGLDSSVALGSYDLINGSATINWANVSNIGIDNAFDLGGGKSAYFETTGLQVVVVPEPTTFGLLAAVAVLGVAARRRA